RSSCWSPAVDRAWVPLSRGFITAVIASAAKQSRRPRRPSTRLPRRLRLLAMTLRPVLDDRAGAQIGERGLVVADLAQHLLGVLTEVRCRTQFFRFRGAGHVDRLADGLQRAELWMIDRPRHLEVLD